MNQLPNELIDRICSFLTLYDLKKALLLSRGFRFAAERHSGAFSRYALNEANAGKFINTFSGHRLQYLRDVEFGFLLPLPEDRDGRDTAEQLSKHDKIFTQQIAFLFNTMKTVEERAGYQNRLGRVRLTICSPLRPIYLDRSISYHHHLSWRVHLLEPSALPLLESIRSLEVEPFWSGLPHTSDYQWAKLKLDYRVMVDLAVKLPNLEYWGCQIGGDEWSPKTEQEATRYLTQDWAGPRRDSRVDFAKALSSTRLPNSLRRLRLDFLFNLNFSTDIDHLTAQPDLVSPAPYDFFSTSLHYLSYHLRRLHLCVVADETLFWPKDNSTPSWPNLESLVVMFHMVSPSGQWYFIGPNGEGNDTEAFKVTDASYPPLETTPYDEDMDWQIDMEGDRRFLGSLSNQMRIVPNDTTLHPFLVAFAKATSNMRALREAALWCPLAWAPEPEDSDEELETDWIPENCSDGSEMSWGLHYRVVGEPNSAQHSTELPVEDSVLWWKVGKWRPDPELHGLFQQIGGRQNGNGLREHWKDAEYGEKLVHRSYFMRLLDK